MIRVGLLIGLYQNNLQIYSLVQNNQEISVSLIWKSTRAIHINNNGIDLTAWKKGSLSPESLELMNETLLDMEDPNKDYGIFQLVQMPANATTDYIATVLAQYQTQFDIDLCILDSIHLLRPNKIRQSSYAELDDILIDIKKVLFNLVGRYEK